MPADRSTDDLTIRPLAPDTWRAFADLVERHNGVFGGCWCTYFHSLSRDKDRTYESNRDLKCQLVEHGRAHAALVFDGDEAVAWAEFGPPGELPNIHHRQEYEAGLVTAPERHVEAARRQEDVVLLPLQRHPQDVRGGRLHLPAVEGTEELRDDPDDRSSLTWVHRQQPDFGRIGCPCTRASRHDRMLPAVMAHG